MKLLVGNWSAHTATSTVASVGVAVVRQVGQGKPLQDKLCSLWKNSLIYRARHVWQNVCKHGKLLGVRNLSKQMEHLVTLSFNPRVTVDSIFSVDVSDTGFSIPKYGHSCRTSVFSLTLSARLGETCYWSTMFSFWSNISPALQAVFLRLFPVSIQQFWKHCVSMGNELVQSMAHT